MQFDIAQENRELNDAEFRIRAKLKRKVLGWAVIERARKRQCARATNLKEGDANTRYFHLRANGRRQKNFIQRLRVGPGWAVSHHEKQEIIHAHFSAMLAAPPSRTKDLRWDNLTFPAVELESLDTPFTEAEILNAIKQLPSDKAPGPDGFTGLFFKRCWPIIKPDVVAAVNAFYNNRCNDLNLLNKATIILIPKKEGAETIQDFRPISLIHAIAKIITKILALRLAPLMNDLTSHCQSAFIKGRSIHDNFMYVRNLARRFHRNKTPALLMKLDFSKAFDSVRWDYLITLLQKRGFPTRWTNWITSILATSTSRVLLNGIPLDPIPHDRGVRQGDPLSPLLFVLAIDPLPRLLSIATARGLLSKLHGRAARFRASLYADDATILIRPDCTDISKLA